MRTETVTLRITREDEGDGPLGAKVAPVRDWQWSDLLDCLPEHVEVVDDDAPKARARRARRR